jgi:hypothetical protein
MSRGHSELALGEESRGKDADIVLNCYFGYSGRMLSATNCTGSNIVFMWSM